MTTENNIVYGGDYDRKFVNVSFGDFILESLKNGGYIESLMNAESGLTWSYADILNETLKYANSFYAFGIKQNDKIAIVAENRNEICGITFAGLCLNAVLAPMNFGYTIRELEHTLNVSKPKIVITSKTALQKVLEACKELKFVQKIIILDDCLSTSSDNLSISITNFHKTFKDPNFNLDEFVKQPNNIYTQSAMIFASSGTTGLPKGCELTQGNLFFSLGQYADILPTFKHFKRFNRSLNIAPWFHVIGFANWFLLILTTQFAIVYLSRFTPQLFCRAIQQYEIINMMAPPPIVIFLAKSPIVDQYDLSSLRLLTSGGAPLTEEVENAIQTRFNGNLMINQSLGMSETFAITCFHKIENPIRGSVGKVLKGTYGKVIDENGIAQGPNKIGELCIKGQNVMKGYIGNPKATAETIDKDGWLHTGDLAYYNEDQYFFVVDRLKELIKYKAYQVAPAELEGLLLSHPKIKDAGVIGIPDDSAGELPFAFVVKQLNVELIESEVVDFVAKNVSNPKKLRGGVKFVDEIPKNPSGKILRRELRELFKNSRREL